MFPWTVLAPPISYLVINYNETTKLKDFERKTILFRQAVTYIVMFSAIFFFSVKSTYSGKGSKSISSITDVGGVLYS